MNAEVSELIAYCRENNRVCPMPQLWNKLYELLPDRKRAGGGWEPSLPLILAAWYEAPALSKMLRLTEHIEWSASHGKLEEVDLFLRELCEEDWHHIGE
jgi:hypothetical protein